MKEEFGDALQVRIFTLDSPEAQGYDFQSATNILLNGEWVSLDVALEKNSMALLVAQKLG